MSHICSKKHLQVERGYEAKPLQYLCLTEDQCMNRHMCEYCLEDDEHAEHLKDHIYPHKQKRIRYIEFENTIKQMVNIIEENRIGDQVKALQTLSDKLIEELQKKINCLYESKAKLNQTTQLISLLYDIKLSEDPTSINNIWIFKLSTVLQTYLKNQTMPQESEDLSQVQKSLEQAIQQLDDMKLNLDKIQDHHVDKEYIMNNPYTSLVRLQDRMKQEEDSEQNVESSPVSRVRIIHRRNRFGYGRRKVGRPRTQAVGIVDPSRVALLFDQLYDHIQLNCNEQVVTLFNLQKISGWPDISMPHVPSNIQPRNQSEKVRYYGQLIGKRNRHGFGVQILKDIYRLGIWKNNHYVWGQTVTLSEYRIQNQKHKLYSIMIGTLRDGRYHRQIRFEREDGEGFNGIIKNGKYQNGIYTGFYVGKQGDKVQYTYQGTFNNNEQFYEGVFDSIEYHFEGTFKCNEFDKGMYTDKLTNETNEVKFGHQRQGEAKITYNDNSLQILRISNRYLGRFRYGKPIGKTMSIQNQNTEVQSTQSKRPIGNDFDEPQPSKKIHNDDV